MTKDPTLDKSWMIALMEEHKIIKMTLDEIITKVREFRELFYYHTSDRSIITYLNGFVGVGIFEFPQDHLSKGKNTIWLYGVGFNKDASDIEEQINLELTLDEAEDYYRVLGNCIKRFKQVNEPRRKK